MFCANGSHKTKQTRQGGSHDTFSQHNTMECPICLASMEVKEEARSWGCPSNHMFHTACENRVRAEALVRRSDAGCPLCSWTSNTTLTISGPTTDVEETIIRTSDTLRRTQAHLRNMNVKLSLKIPLVRAMAASGDGLSSNKAVLLECLDSAELIANESALMAGIVMKGLEAANSPPKTTKGYMELHNCVISLLSAVEEVCKTHTYIVHELHKLFDGGDTSRNGLVV